MTIAQILRAARERCERDWVNHNPSPGECCVLTSIAESIDSGSTYRQRDATREIFLKVIDPKENTSIIFWNDAPGRTKAEVLEAFDRAIAEAERRGI